jgi:hypothetical protein
MEEGEKVEGGREEIWDRPMSQDFDSMESVSWRCVLLESDAAGRNR